MGGSRTAHGSCEGCTSVTVLLQLCPGLGWEGFGWGHLQRTSVERNHTFCRHKSAVMAYVGAFADLFGQIR